MKVKKKVDLEKGFLDLLFITLLHTSTRCLLHDIKKKTNMYTNYFVYITTNPAKTVLYIGVTNNIERRIKEHYNNRGKNNTFAGKYFCYKLIHYEEYLDINQAIEREKELKDLSRQKKEEIISTKNPKWNFIDV